MRVITRLTTLVEEEHTELREALRLSDESVQAILIDRARVFEVRETRDAWGGRHSEPTTDVDRSLVRIEPATLKRDWHRYHTLVTGWMARYGAELVPAVRGWSADGDAEHLALARAVIARLQKDRAAIESQMATLRRQATFVPPLKAALHPAFEHVELCGRVEDVEITPAVLAGSPETSDGSSASHSGRYRTADDVSRSLRQSLPSEPAPEPPKGLLASLKRMLGG